MLRIQTCAVGAALLLGLTASFVPPQKGKAVDPPPGMVHVKGGRTVIGTKVKRIEEMLVENPPLRQFAGGFISETPQHKVPVDDFFLMVTETTNEQFAAYVRATGAKPPRTTIRPSPRSMPRGARSWRKRGASVAKHKRRASLFPSARSSTTPNGGRRTGRRPSGRSRRVRTASPSPSSTTRRPSPTLAGPDCD